MKRAGLIVLLLATIVVSIDWLADRTQDRPDRIVPGSRSELVIDMKVRHDRGPASLTRAQGLWGACQHTGGRRVAPPGLVEVGAGRFSVVVEPALGDHSWRRLKGCLEDMTIDRMTASVVSKRDF